MKAIFLKQQFFPGVLAVFLNPFYFIRKGLYKSIKKLSLQLNGDILDFGCGSKPYVELFSHANSYIGVDIDDRGHGHENELIDIYYDGKTIPLSDESKDCIFTSEVFEHIDNLDEIVPELYRVLKKNGKILITVPFVFMEHEMPYDFRRYSVNGLSNILVRNGFEIISTHKSTKDIETIFQCINVYLFSLFMNLNKYLRMLLVLLIIAPITIIGIILSFLLPNKGRFYSNSIILAKK
jgi:SAM-dependent methyltransferase